MKKVKPEGLDELLLNPVLRLEQELHGRDGPHDPSLDAAHVHVVREPHDVKLETDECELILATDFPLPRKRDGVD